MADHAAILTETCGRVLLITLNRPEALNAINRQLAREVIAAAQAAGADIREMQGQTFSTMNAADWFAEWEAFAALRKPIIAAVAGHALGGGCELAMMCDLIIAAETARFGQPEVKLGVMPGMGGSQRLTRAIGQAKAMDMCLTGRMMDAAEADRLGLVSRVVPAEALITEAMAMAETIASMSLPAAMSIKDAVRRATDMALADGLRYERRLFHALFATADQEEGMAAFIEKRPAHFRHG